MQQQEDNHYSACERFCRTLSRCYELAAPSLADARAFNVFASDARHLDSRLCELAEDLVASLAEDDATALERDFEQLFVGTPRMLAPPCGSVWLDGAQCVIGVSTLGVIGLFRDGDFDLDDDFVEPPDHIAAELQFLHRLIVRRHAAEQTGDRYALTETEALKRRLLDEHLGRWVEPFSRAIGSAAQTRFYRTLGAITLRFVQLEAEAADCESPALAEAT